MAIEQFYHIKLVLKIYLKELHLITGLYWQFGKDYRVAGVSTFYLMVESSILLMEPE